MKKKTFWRRCNRGFIVSMVLLAAVIVYISATNIMQIPAKQEIRKLAEDFRGYMVTASQLSDEQIASFQDDNALKNENSRLKSELTALFNEKSSYVDAAVQLLTDTIENQTQGQERITSRGDAKLTNSSYHFDQDTATYEVTYSYTVSGGFYDYKTNGLTQLNDVPQTLHLSITCKKTDGKWKLYRISQADWVLDRPSADKGGTQK